jgi:hypothetical protein
MEARNMCYNPGAGAVPAHHAGGCGCGCGTSPWPGRRFLSKEEEAERLKAYRQELLTEAAEVERRIADLAKR